MRRIISAAVLAAAYHSYAGMTPADLDALVAYLRSLKPLATK